MKCGTTIAAVLDLELDTGRKGDGEVRKSFVRDPKRFLGAWVVAGLVAMGSPAWALTCASKACGTGSDAPQTTSVTVPAAQSDFNIGLAINYGLLYEGNGGKALNFNNSNLNGNIGIGGTGTFKGNQPGAITGNIDFSAASAGQYSNNGLTVTGTVSYGIGAVATALNTINSLSQTLGTESGTSTTISSGGSVNASAGTLVDGDRVFTVTSVNFPANHTFTINGSSSDYVVFNIPFSASLNGSIVLTGGIGADHVLFNFTPSPSNLITYNNDYASLSGGPTMTINTNGATTTGVFLDPTGTFSVNHSQVAGRIFGGGDSHDVAFVSGANLTAPSDAKTSVPAPATLLLVSTALGVLAVKLRRDCKKA